MGRYIYTKILDNSNEYYRFLRSKRQNQKNIQHYATPSLFNPDLIDRMVVPGNTYLWKVGDHFWKLAADYYNNANYWWVIAWYNGYPTEADISPGAMIEIPLSLEKALLALGF